MVARPLVKPPLLPPSITMGQLGEALSMSAMVVLGVWGPRGEDHLVGSFQCWCIVGKNTDRLSRLGTMKNKRQELKWAERGARHHIAPNRANFLIPTLEVCPKRTSLMFPVLGTNWD